MASAPHLRMRSQDGARLPVVGRPTSGNGHHNVGHTYGSKGGCSSVTSSRRLIKSDPTKGSSDDKIRADANASVGKWMCNRMVHILVPVAVIILFFVITFGNSIVFFERGSGGSSSGINVGGNADIRAESRWSGAFSGQIPNPPPQSIIRARTQRWKEVENDECRFATDVNEDKTYYNMAKGAWWMEYAEDLRRGHFQSMLKSTDKKRAEALKRKRREALEEGKRSISFIHIGKAGGTSIQCNIRQARGYSVHCDKKAPFPAIGDKESQVSKLINCYLHSPYEDYFECFDNPTLLINIRNPIDRLASSYHYEHIRNKPKKDPTCGQAMLYRCYDSFYDLAEYGLGGVRPPPTKVLRIEQDLPEEECRHWAWATVQGTAPVKCHNFFNYDWYMHGTPALDDEKEVIAYRTEHLEDDWRRVEVMLGGDGSLPSNLWGNDSSQKDWPVNNKTVSERGHLNLCRALCHEIQVYKQILVRAINLNNDDVRVSLKELDCPDDMTPEIRFCPQNYFDYQI
mmetsp:Transcript_36302/g.79409  ORF Transcript_36302/g.79409 Transcript_36302/m.79409 type:complete len:513 (-) Transcript_36302:115-1653(-)